MASFNNQNLQSRSFQGQLLNGADFSGSDIRGCNFRNAQLVEANFERVKAGLSPQKFMRLSGVMSAIALLVGDALSRLIFGALGQIPGSSAWSFVLVLYGVLSAVAVSSGISSLATNLSRDSRSLKALSFVQSVPLYVGSRSLNGIPPTIRKIARTFSAVLSGALLGFFYAGSASGNNSTLEIAGAIAASLLMFFASIFLSQAWVKLTILTIATVTIYSAAFLLGATASIHLSAQQIGMGTMMAIASLLCVWLTLNSLKQILRSLKLLSTTSFNGANLLTARFDRAELHHTDFSQTIGYFNQI